MFVGVSKKHNVIAADVCIHDGSSSIGEKTFWFEYVRDLDS